MATIEHNTLTGANLHDPKGKDGILALGAGLSDAYLMQNASARDVFRVNTATNTILFSNGTDDFAGQWLGTGTFTFGGTVITAGPAATQRIKIESTAIQGAAVLELSSINALPGTSAIHMGDSVDPDAGRIVYTHDLGADRMDFITAGVTAAVISSGQFWGFGTVAPTTKVDVRGQIAASLADAGSPAYTFVGDLDTGIFSSGANTVNISALGTQVSQFSSIGIGNIDGGSGSPSYAFTSDTNTGMYRVAENRLGFATNGSARAEFDATGNMLLGGTTVVGSQTRTLQITAIGSNQSVTLNLQGEFTGANGTVSGTRYFNGATNEIANVFAFRDTTNNSGAIAWATHNGTTLAERMRLSRSGQLGLGITIPTALLDVRGQIVSNANLVTLPAYSFVGDTNTGMYSDLGDTISWATNGIRRMELTSSQVILVTGDAAAPSYSFQADLDTGMYQASPDVVGLSTAGTVRAEISTAEFFYNSVTNNDGRTYTVTGAATTVDLQTLQPATFTPPDDSGGWATLKATHTESGSPGSSTYWRHVKWEKASGTASLSSVVEVISDDEVGDGNVTFSVSGGVVRADVIGKAGNTFNWAVTVTWQAARQ